MKSSRINKKKKKKDRTWAEAATLAIQQSPAKMLGIRPILHTIYNKKFKDISMNKAAENVLTTMLNHHAQLPNCPFYRVKGKMGLYALKESWMKKNGEMNPKSEISISSSEELIRISEERVPAFNDIVARENHTYSIQGKPFSPEENKTRASSTLRRKATITSDNGLLSQKSVLKEEFNSHSGSSPNQVNTKNLNTSTTRIHLTNNDHVGGKSPKVVPCIDLETPSSILVNANMRSLVNKDTFSMLPPSYQYKLTNYLPQCDQVVSDKYGKGQQIFVPSSSALTNEFFTQAVQEWRERLTDGEFTRETQSRIVQEIAKERGKIDPWKEQFFEEYYGQNRQIPSKRLRSRSHNLAAAEVGHQLRDLGMEAQLQLFAHLKPDVKEVKGDDINFAESDLEISDPEFEDTDDLPLDFIRKQRLQNSTTQPPSSNPQNIRPVKNGYSDYPIRNKTISKTVKSRNNKSHAKFKKQLPTGIEIQQRLKENLDAKIPPSLVSPVVMKPSGYLRSNYNVLLSNTSNDEVYSYSDGESSRNDEKMLKIRKNCEIGSAVIAEHSYTSVLWQKGNQSKSNLSTNNNSAVTNPLILSPKGNIFNLTEKLPTSNTKMNDNFFVALLDSKQDIKSISSPSIVNKESTPEHMLIPSNKQLPQQIVLAAKSFNHLLSPIKQFANSKTEDSVIRKSDVFDDKLKPIHIPLCSHSQSVLAEETKLVTTSELKTTSVTSHITCVTTSIPNVPTTQHAVHGKQTLSLQSTTADTMNKIKSIQNSFTNISSKVANNSKLFLSPVSSSLLQKSSVFNKNTNLSNLRFVNHNPVRTCASSISPVVPAKMLTGIKRPHPSSVIKVSPNSLVPTKWGASISPSPIKKTRTLAEIKAQMKANKAAATKSESPVFSSASSPVYFPVKTTMSPTIAPVLSKLTPVTSPTYVRLSTTTTVGQLDQIRWSDPKPILADSTKMHVAVTLSGPISCSSKITPLRNCNMITKGFVPTETNKERWNSSVLSSPTTQNKGKIILKIKTAGSAILRKVDADVIKKGLKEAESSEEEEEKSEEDDDKSSSSENTDTDDAESPIKTAARYTSSTPVVACAKNINKVQYGSCGSKAGESAKKWTSNVGQIKDAHFKLNPRTSSLSTTTNTTIVKPPIFGISPYNLSVTSNSASLDRNVFAGNHLFQAAQSPVSFFQKQTISGENFNKVTTPVPTGFVSNKYRSTSKGKSIQQMQELARSNRIHSDDSSENDDDHADSSFSTSTASENDKCSDSDVSDTALELNKTVYKRPLRSNTLNKSNSSERATSVHVLPSPTVLNK